MVLGPLLSARAVARAAAPTMIATIVMDPVCVRDFGVGAGAFFSNLRVWCLHTLTNLRA